MVTPCDTELKAILNKGFRRIGCGSRIRTYDLQVMRIFRLIINNKSQHMIAIKTTR